MGLFNRLVRRGNMMLGGGGAGTTQDRGALQTAAPRSTNPWHWQDTLRWREYVKWYETAWEARKIVNIPPEDALREPFDITGIADDQARELKSAFAALELDRQVLRALVQERLLGGSILLPVIKMDQPGDLMSPLDISALREGDLLAVNVVDVSMISAPSVVTDPFRPEFDQRTEYRINGVPLHPSRMAALDGAPLLARSSRPYLAGKGGYSRAGFGQSVLEPIYDLMLRVVGTQQGAYHLVNMSSVLILAAKNLMSLQASGSPAMDTLKEVVEQISIYRGAVIDGDKASVGQHSASFGSVPELVMTFAQLLSVASDINAVRFLGQAPGGLNATGQSDLETHYNHIAAYQRQHVRPIHLKMLEFVGASLWGGAEWARRSKGLDIVYPKLWNLSAQEQATVDNTYGTLLMGLYASGLIGGEAAVNEMLSRGIFKNKVDAEDALDSFDPRAPSPLDPGAAAAIAKMSPS